MLALWNNQTHSMQTSGMNLSQKIKIPRDCFQTIPGHLEICSSPWHCCRHCSVTKSCQTFSDPMDWSMPSLFVLHYLPEFQFSSVTQLCLTICTPLDCRTPGFPVLHQLPELAKTRVHQVGDAIQLFYPLSSPSPPVFNLAQHQGFFPVSQFFASGGQSIGVSASASSVLEWIFRTDFL